MSKPFLRVVKNEANQSAQIFLYGIIGDYWYSDNPLTAKGFLRQLSLLADYQIIHVHCNGPGGDIHEGLAICNIIQASKKEIHVWNDGLCASMFAIILASAKKGRRHGAKGSLTMIHDASTGCWGNAAEMRETADMLDKHNSVLAEFITDATGLAHDQVISKWMDGKDHWLTAKEAEAENLLIIEDYEAQPLPEHVQEAPMDKIAAFYGGTIPSSDSQIKNENMFGNPFKKLSDLAKVAAPDITADHVKAVNDEIEKEKIPGVTLVLDTELKKVTDKADLVDGLNQKVTDLETAGSQKDQKIKDLENTIAEQKQKLGLPAEEVITPTTDKIDDTTQKKEVEDKIETPQDKEQAEILRVSNLIP